MRSKSRRRDARSRARLSVESMEARLTPSGAGIPDLTHPAQVKITEYNVATGQQRTLGGTESMQALGELQAVNAQAWQAGYAGIGGLLGSMDVPDGSATPNFVFGADGRTRVNNPAGSYPFRAIGQIYAHFPPGNPDGTDFVSSGAMVSEFHMLTASHCVKLQDEYGGHFATQVSVALGQDGEQFGSGALQSNNRYFGEANAVLYRAYAITLNDLEYDIALITLDRRIGNFTGWFGYGYDDDDGYFEGRNFNTAGYPGDLNNGTHYQFRAFDPITSVTDHELRSNVMDTNGGNSGGPLWSYNSTTGDRFIWGVCSHGSSSNGVPLYNAWTRITSDKYTNLLVNPIAEDRAQRAPTDRPDLIEWDQWFNANTASMPSSLAQTGQPWSVSINTRNNGTLAAGSFRVSFYASTDGTIGAGDYLIGESTASSLDPFHWTATGWSGNFPSTIPQGTYTVGWIIDSGSQQSEFNEVNNVGTFTQPLTVDVRGGTVTGFVFEDLNGNGSFDPTEPGVPNVPVYFDQDRNGQLDSNETVTLTGASGGYVLTALEDGFYAVRQIIPAGYRQLSSNPPDLLLTDGNFNVVNFGDRRIGGTVVGGAFADQNGNGVRDAGDSPLANATIYVDANHNRRLDAGETFTTTAADGSYQLSFDADGDYAIRIQRPNGSAYSTPIAPTIHVEGGATINPVDFGLMPSPRLYAIGTGEGTPARVKVYNADGTLRRVLSPYGAFAGGARVATGDFNDDGVPDIVTGAGPGGGPHVEVFDGKTGDLLHSFYPYAQAFTGGLYIATGDVNGDGVPEIITGVGVGGGPHVRVFDIVHDTVLREWIAYDFNFRGGVIVSAGDVDGDGRADVITGVGPGGGPHVRIFSGADGSVLREWIAYDLNFRGGVIVSAGDVDGDGRADVITGVGPGGGPHVKVFSGATGQLLHEWIAYDLNFRGGVVIATRDIDGDGKAEIITVPGKGGGPHVKIFNGGDYQLRDQFFAFDPSFFGGIYVG